MSQRFFADAAQWARLQNAALRWEGTPYKAGGKTCKIGVDCVNFVSRLCLESGVIRCTIDRGVYPRKWYATRENAIVSTIDEYMANCLGLDVDYRKSSEDLTAWAGDLLCLQINSPVVNHVAIKLRHNAVIHASTRAKKVVIESLEAYEKYLKTVYSFWRRENNGD